MNQLLGLGITGLSVMVAAVVSGLRLKPYLDAGEARTPLTFAFYPALIAAAIAVPVVFILRKWQGKTDVDIGPVTFTGNMPFIALGCVLYVIVAVTFFPYQGTRPRPPRPGEVQAAVGYKGQEAGRLLRPAVKAGPPSGSPSVRP
jgi:hypothetical protein